MQNLGNYKEDFADLNFKFSTRTLAQVPITLGGTPAVSVYKSNDLTQSTAGVTLTVDFDGVTGLHNVKIDLSADAFYAAGEDYVVVVTTGTVDSVSVVGTVIASFSIAARVTDVVAVAGTAQTAGDLAALITTLDAVADAVKAVTDLLPNAGALTTIGTDTARLTAARAQVLDDWINGGRLDLLLDAIPTTAMRGTDSAATAAALVTTDAVVDAISAKLAGITLLAEWLGALAGKQVPDATALAEIKASGAGSGTYDATTDSLEAVRDNQSGTPGYEVGGIVTLESGTYTYLMWLEKDGQRLTGALLTAATITIRNESDTDLVLSGTPTVNTTTGYIRGSGTLTTALGTKKPGVAQVTVTYDGVAYLGSLALVNLGS